MATLPPTFLRTTLYTNELIGNIIVNGSVNLSSNLQATYFIGNGSQLTGLDQAALPTTGHLDVVGNLTGDYANVGTLYVAQTAYFTGQVNVIGNMSTQGMIYASALNTIGNVTADYFIGNGALLTDVVATYPPRSPQMSSVTSPPPETCPRNMSSEMVPSSPASQNTYCLLRSPQMSSVTSPPPVTCPQNTS